MAEYDDQGDPLVSRIFRYILRHDTGMAPCVDDGLVTLATCKPRIRQGAGIGDWVIGCRSMANGGSRGMVVWVGRVAASIEWGEYERLYRGRSDAVYRAMPNGEFKRLKPDYHPAASQIRKDLSAPVLVFDCGSTWYFGRHPHTLPDHLDHLAPSGIGHRVNVVKQGDIEALRKWLEGIAPPGTRGRPHDKPGPSC